MKILVLGDVVGKSGTDYVASRLWNYRKSEKIDFVIINAENSAEGNGIDRESTEKLFSAGADVLTTGNHVFKRAEAKSLLEKNNALLRPENFSGELPGDGSGIYDACGLKILVINIMGVVNIQPTLDNPFTAADRVLLRHKGQYDISFVDFHAEPTSEKRAMGFYLDGRVTCLFGTHTHVQTADEQILPKGTAYITDVGMCGSTQSVLGVKPERIIEKLKYGVPTKFETETTSLAANGIVVTLNVQNRAEKIERVIL